MEWLDRHRYSYETLHPPLARVAVALGPWLDGGKSLGREGIEQEGTAILHEQGHYARSLRLARLGVLPFFIAAAILVGAWTYRIAGGMAGVLAVALFVTTPPILAHAGLATTDMPVTCTLTATLWAFVGWLEHASPRRTIVLGLALGLSVLTKLSVLLFLPAAVVATLLALAVSGWTRSDRALRRPTVVSLLTAMALAAGVIWAGYRFSIGSVADALVPLRMGIVWGDGIFGAIARARVLPAPELLTGLLTLVAKDVQGHKSFLLGEVRLSGWWYFFPVALAVKSPLPLLVLAGAAVPVCISRGRSRAWRVVVPATAAFAMLLASLASHINIGVRHLLPVYPLLAVVAGTGGWWLWSRWRRVGPLLVVGLLGAQTVTAVRAWPDLLPHFNPLAGTHPERVLVDSDLDWGQDLGRLADTLRSRGIRRVALAYAGSADLRRHDLPDFAILKPDQPTTGWVAISELVLANGWFYDDSPPYDGYRWLERHTPVTRAGRSIRVYYIAPGNPQ
ncbi:MAG: glycosyltransferase family 39 protein [Gemmatimonadota bacterium]|nr:glycosyltransferase family 39 protein [Gemmatimonadota bacterium]